MKCDKTKQYLLERFSALVTIITVTKFSLLHYNIRNHVLDDTNENREWQLLYDECCEEYRNKAGNKEEGERRSESKKTRIFRFRVKINIPLSNHSIANVDGNCIFNDNGKDKSRLVADVCCNMSFFWLMYWSVSVARKCIIMFSVSCMFALFFASIDEKRKNTQRQKETIEIRGEYF